jgi:hypothetical protein
MKKILSSQLIKEAREEVLKRLSIPKYLKNNFDIKLKKDKLRINDK